MKHLSGLIISLALMLGVSNLACNTAKEVANQLIDCTEPQITGLATALIPTVEELLTGATPNWAADLDTLTNVLGAIGACAVTDAIQDIDGHLNSGSGSGMSPAEAAMWPTLKYNGTQYLLTKKWKFK